QVGNTGSTRKFKYGPHGHTVNLASRVQNLSKHFRTPLLISAETRSGLPPGFVARRLGLVHLPGIDTPVDVHELPPVARGGDWPAYRDSYESALAMYEAGRLEEAHQALLSLIDTRQVQESDIPARLLIARVQECMKNPSASYDSAIYRT